MHRIFLILFRIFCAFCIALFVALVMVYVLVARSIPDYDKTLKVAGVSKPVEIVRNTWNVPHIFAKNDEDAIFALGYVHTQDRLWQMMLMRRKAQGRMAEMFGPKSLQDDIFMRSLDLYALSRRSYAVLPPHIKRLLDAYSDGVNAKLKELNENAMGRGAPEFFIFSNPISPWHAVDSIALLKLNGVHAAVHLENEVLHAQLLLQLGQERAADLLESNTDITPTLLLETEPSLGFNENAHPDFAGIMATQQGRRFSNASNAWAVGKSRTVSNGTLLASDPHTALSAPAPFYLARLQLASGDVIGATQPGIPAILHGRTQKLGWGLTNAYVDDQDVYIERLNPANPDQYLSPDGFVDFTKKQITVGVKDQPPVSVTLRWTQNGPVLPAQYAQLNSITPAGHVSALAWSVLNDQDTSIQAIIELMQASSVSGALEATQSYIAPAQNLILADQNNIAMATIGALPLRHPAHQTKGQYPSFGWQQQNQWQGVLPPAARPVFFNPSDGTVGNTNNKIIDRPFPRHLSFHWGDTQRIMRWSKLMQDNKVHTLQSFIDIQQDTISPAARTLLPLIAANLWYQPANSAQDEQALRRQTALDLLANWNGDMNEHQPEPLLYSAWIEHFQKRVLQDELGALAQKFTHIDSVFLERVLRDVNGAGKWCDIVQSSPVETCAQIASAALDDALLWLVQNYGPNIVNYRWGNAHIATHNHSVFAHTPILNFFVNIHQSTSGGDNTLQRGLTRGSGNAPYHNVHGSTYRGVYDFADPESSVFIISIGQSGHPLSRFYDNLGDLWRRGEYIPMTLEPALARAGAIGVTMLEPIVAQ